MTATVAVTVGLAEIVLRRAVAVMRPRWWQRPTTVLPDTMLGVPAVANRKPGWRVVRTETPSVTAFVAVFRSELRIFPINKSE